MRRCGHVRSKFDDILMILAIANSAMGKKWLYGIIHDVDMMMIPSCGDGKGAVSGLPLGRGM